MQVVVQLDGSQKVSSHELLCRQKRRWEGQTDSNSRDKRTNDTRLMDRNTYELLAKTLGHLGGIAAVHGTDDFMDEYPEFTELVRFRTPDISGSRTLFGGEPSEGFTRLG